MDFILDRKFLILALIVSWLTAVIELLTVESPRMIVYLPYGLIVPLLILLPRIVYKFNSKINSRFSTKLVTEIELLLLGIIVASAPGSLWLHDMGIQYDRFLHFAVSFMSLPILILIFAAFGIEKRKKNLLITIPLLFLGLFAFEVYQYSVDVIFGTQLFYDAAQNIKIDVVEDIIFGIAGGLLGIYFYVYRLDIFKNLQNGGKDKLVSLLILKHFFIYSAFCLLALVAFIAITNAIFYFGTKKYIYQDIKDAPTAQAALVPGAAVLRNGALSLIFKDRVDKSIELYNAGKVQKILVSGDNSTESYNEVNPVRHYLLENGIPEGDIFLDHAGFDTYSTMYRARDIFKIDSLVVSTQSFHLPRSVFIARKLGMEAYGINSDKGNILRKNYIREMFANEKAVIDMMFFRKPKYLGEEIPITGDGRMSL